MVRRLVILTVLFVLSITTSVRGQWIQLKTFPASVQTVYFLDQLGAPNTGFVGLADGEIWTTNNNGSTWSQTTTPNGNVVQQFAFRNSTQGWAAVSSGGIWTTTNGGLSWVSTGLNANLSWVGVSYCATSGELIAIDRSDNDYQSSDFGANWTKFGSLLRNGGSFSGSMGITSTYLNSQSMLYSADGGLSWSSSSPSLMDEMWSPHLIPGTSTGFAVGERTAIVYKTTNGGQSWSQSYHFPTQTPTGTIMGSLAAMFVQTTINGFYYSTDQGTTWNPVCGPSNNMDSRFYAKGKEVFAGDGGRTLWYIPDGTQGSGGALTLDRTSIPIYGVRCRQTDSAIRITIAGGCGGGKLLKATMLSGSPAFSVGTVQLPKSLVGRDSIRVSYTPSKLLRDTGTLLLQIQNDGRTFDTLITLYGAGVQSSNYSHSSNIFLYSPYACSERDSSLIITNLSCDTLTLTSALLSDSSHFHIQVPTLPVKMGPYDSDTILISVTSQKDGTFQSLLRLLLLGSAGVIRDSVPLRFDVTQGAHAIFGELQLTFPNRCESLDTTFTIATTPCDSIRLLVASLIDSTVFRLGFLSLPLTIPAGGGISLPIQVVSQPKGNYSTLLHVRYLSGQRLVDTTVVLSLEVSDDLPVAMSFTYPSLDLGTVNVPCGHSDLDFWIGDTLCRDMQIMNVAIEPPDDEYSLDALTFPLTVRSWDSAGIHVHFKPSAVGSFTHNLRVTMNLDGRIVDTLIPMYSEGVSRFSDTLLTPRLRFDTLLRCEQQELTADIINLSCNDIVALRTLLKDTANFEIVSPLFPHTIPSGDTLHVRFRLKPQRSGELADSVTIMVHNPADGKDYPTKVALSGYILPNVHKVMIDSLVAMNHLNVPPCGSTMDSVVLHNNGSCDDVVISLMDMLGYSGVTFVPAPSLPIILHPGDSTKFVFLIVPDVDAKQTSQIHVKGINIDTILTLNYACVAGAHAMTLTAKDSNFITRRCQSVSKHFVIASTGCASVILDSVAIAAMTGQTQFIISNFAGKLPVTLAPNDTMGFDVTFDPDGTGDSLASVSVRSIQGSFRRTVALNGDVRGVIPNARIALISADRKHSIASRPEMPVSVKVIAVDAIGDTCALQTLTFDLHYNWSLLTAGDITAAPGWSIVSSKEQPDGILTVGLHRDVHADIPDSTVLAEIAFKTTLGDSIATNITLNNLQLNDGDANYARCTLSWQATNDSVRYTTIDSCGNPAERDLINNNLALSRISVRPNPAPIEGNKAHALLEFTLNQPSTVKVVLRDIVGREFNAAMQPLTEGAHQIVLDLPGVSQGAYFVIIDTDSPVGHSKLTRKLLIQAP